MSQEPLFDKFHLFYARWKATHEGLRQYIVIQPIYNSIIVTRFTGQGDKILKVVEPYE